MQHIVGISQQIFHYCLSTAFVSAYNPYPVTYTRTNNPLIILTDASDLLGREGETEDNSDDDNTYAVTTTEATATTKNANDTVVKGGGGGREEE
eukprot:1684889-Ditylum_brightwellii.AAC.1